MSRLPAVGGGVPRGVSERFNGVNVDGDMLSFRVPRVRRRVRVGIKLDQDDLVAGHVGDGGLIQEPEVRAC